MRLVQIVCYLFLFTFIETFVLAFEKEKKRFTIFKLSCLVTSSLTIARSRPDLGQISARSRPESQPEPHLVAVESFNFVVRSFCNFLCSSARDPQRLIFALSLVVFR